MEAIEIGAFEAKNRLSELLAQAEKGQRIYITRRGKRVAVLSRPEDPDEGEGSASGGDLLERVRAYRGRARNGPEPIKALVEEGRR